MQILFVTLNENKSAKGKLRLQEKHICQIKSKIAKKKQPVFFFNFARSKRNILRTKINSNTTLCRGNTLLAAK